MGGAGGGQGYPGYGVWHGGRSLGGTRGMGPGVGPYSHFCSKPGTGTTLTAISAVEPVKIMKKTVKITKFSLKT